MCVKSGFVFIFFYIFVSFNNVENCDIQPQISHIGIYLYFSKEVFFILHYSHDVL